MNIGRENTDRTADSQGIETCLMKALFNLSGNLTLHCGMFVANKAVRLQSKTTLRIIDNRYLVELEICRPLSSSVVTSDDDLSPMRAFSIFIIV